MVRNIPFPSEEVKILPAAKECFRVFFNEENSLEVRPCLRLKDGRILDRQDLAENRFSGAYYLDGEGFLPTTRLPTEGTFSNPSKPVSALPLLGFLQNEETRDSPFTVAPNDIPAFLSANQKPLHFPDNIIDPDLLQLQIREFPDRLVIDSFEERDDWCYLSCHYGLGNTSITLNDILTAREQNLTCLPGKQWLQIDGTPLSWLYELAEDRFDARFRQDSPQLPGDAGPHGSHPRGQDYRQEETSSTKACRVCSMWPAGPMTLHSPRYPAICVRISATVWPG